MSIYKYEWGWVRLWGVHYQKWTMEGQSWVDQRKEKDEWSELRVSRIVPSGATQSNE